MCNTKGPRKGQQRGLFFQRQSLSQRRITLGIHLFTAHPTPGHHMLQHVSWMYWFSPEQEEHTAMGISHSVNVGCTNLYYDSETLWLCGWPTALWLAYVTMTRVCWKYGYCRRSGLPPGAISLVRFVSYSLLLVKLGLVPHLLPPHGAEGNGLLDSNTSPASLYFW